MVVDPSGECFGRGWWDRGVESDEDVAVFGDGDGLEDVEVECAAFRARKWISHCIFYATKTERNGRTWRWC